MANPARSPGTALLQDYELAGSRVILSPSPSDDPNDPLNWAMWRKVANFGLASIFSLVAMSSVMMKPTLWPDMGPDLDLTTDQLTHGQSANLAGLATGCLFFIPFAVKYGRRLVYILSLAVLAAAAWWTAAMHTYTESIIVSVLSGLSCAINETLVQMTIIDMFFVHQRASANGAYFFATMIGGFLVPMLAGIQAARDSWRWSYYSMAIALTVVLVLFVLFYEETKYVPTMEGETEMRLSSRLQDARDDPPALVEDTELTNSDDKNDINRTISKAQASYRTNSYRERMRLLTPTSERLSALLIRPFYVFLLPHVLYTAIEWSFDICAMVMFSAMNPIIFGSPPYNFNTGAIGYMNVGPLIGTILGSIYGGVLCDKVTLWLAKRNHGVYEPEMRLYLLPLPATCMSGGLIMYGVTAAYGMHWIYPSIGGAIYGFGMNAKGDINFTFLLDTYHELAAEAFIAVTFLRNAASIGIPLSLVPWRAGMGLVNMFIVAGCVSFGISLLFIPMIIYGKRMRTALASRYYNLAKAERAL